MLDAPPVSVDADLVTSSSFLAVRCASFHRYDWVDGLFPDDDTSVAFSARHDTILLLSGFVESVCFYLSPVIQTVVHLILYVIFVAQL